MRKSKFTETQIVSILREHEAGKKAADLCREHGVSQPTFYQWKSRYGGLEPNQLKELKDLKAEHARLKRLYAEACMDREALKDLLSGKALGPAAKRECVHKLVEQRQMSVRRVLQADKAQWIGAALPTPAPTGPCHHGPLACFGH